MYPTIIYNVAKYYNEAYVLVEINDIGQQVVDILHHEVLARLLHECKKNSTTVCNVWSWGPTRIAKVLHATVHGMRLEGQILGR